MTKILNFALKIKGGVVGRVAHEKSSDPATPSKFGTCTSTILTRNRLYTNRLYFFMKGSCAKDLNNVNTKSNLCICILIFYEPAKLTRGFKWYMEIKVINLMSFFLSNNVIL